MGRTLLVLLALAIALALPFIFWGEHFEERLSGEGAAIWLESYGAYAWATGIGLLIADLVLPIPTTAVMAALGIVYGPLLGGAIASAGSVASGAIGYGIGRYLGRPVVLRLVGAAALAEGDRLFARAGGWFVALSRWLPIVSEVVACAAGLARMPRMIFAAALLCGSLPLGFVFAVIGAAGERQPLITLAVSALAPFLLWGLLRPWLRRRAAGQ